jgi:hypothetical protein
LLRNGRKEVARSAVAQFTYTSLAEIMLTATCEEEAEKGRAIYHPAFFEIILSN